jgi:hypothetical protein
MSSALGRLRAWAPRAPRRLLALLFGDLGRGRRLFVLLAGLWLIVGWQRHLADPDRYTLERTHRVYASTGVHGEAHFFFFQYHLGLFPLATDAPILKDTHNEAERLLRASPEKLKQDEGVTFRSGDRGRVFLYYVDKWTGGSASDPRLRPANAAAFVTALCALWLAFWAIGHPWFGALLVALLGSNPFQLHSVYNEENVFSWSITTMIFVLAIQLPLMLRPPTARFGRAYVWAAPLITAALVASIRTVRSEPTPVILGAILVYLTLPRASWSKRLALVVMLVGGMWAGNQGYERLFLSKFRETQRMMERVGAEPYKGPVRVYHEVWHALFCGLGDFDKTYGYKWDDLAAYRYAYPQLKAMNPDKPYLNPGRAPQTVYYDDGKKYAIYYSETPGYDEIIRDKILGDIRRDPKWFREIIKQRLWRVLTDSTPVSIAIDGEQLGTKSALLGLLSFPVLFFLLITRRWFLARLLVFSAPLAIPALAVYSDRGMSYYSCVHIFVAAIFAALAAEGAKVWLRRRGESARGPS